MNVKFLLATYFIAIIVDWIFQTDGQAVNKSKWSKDDDNTVSFFALLSHSNTYAYITSCVLCILRYLNGEKFIIVYLTLLISHMIIDTRIPVKWIMKMKGMSNEQINDPNFGFMHIGIDHRLHELVILILSFIV